MMMMMMMVMVMDEDDDEDGGWRLDDDGGGVGGDGVGDDDGDQYAIPANAQVTKKNTTRPKPRALHGLHAAEVAGPPRLRRKPIPDGGMAQRDGSVPSRPADAVVARPWRSLSRATEAAVARPRPPVTRKPCRITCRPDANC